MNKVIDELIKNNQNSEAVSGAESVALSDELQELLLNTVNNTTVDLDRLIINSTSRRNILLKKAESSASKRKYITFSGGIISILSALTYTVVITKIIPSSNLEVAAVGLAVLGGVLSLFGSLIFNESETMHLFVGASKYLHLVEDANKIQKNHNKMRTNKQVDEYYKLQDRFNQMSLDYDRYAVKMIPTPPPEHNDRFLAKEARSSTQSGYYGFTNGNSPAQIKSSIKILKEAGIDIKS